MRRSKTPSYILQLELTFNGISQPSVLERLSHCAASIYNACLSEALRRLHNVQHDRDYQKLQEEYKKEKKDNLVLSTFSAQYKEIYKKYGYTEFALYFYVKTIRKHYPNFGAAMAQAIASRAFYTTEKVRLNKTKSVRFISSREGCSFEGRSNLSTICYRSKDNCIHYGKYCFGLKIKSDDEYAMQCMQDRVKYVRILKRTIRGKKRWFCQLILEGTPPDNARHKRIYGTGKAGIDPGVSTMAIVTEKKAHLKELASECQEDENRIRRIQRAMNRSRRAVNPDNYKPDGTSKSGKLQWRYSKRYQELKNELTEAQRINRVKREVSHHELAKEILTEASDIRTETMFYANLARRSANITHNRKNGRINSKKRYGKTLHNRAPSRFISILDEKLSYIGKSVTKVNTAKIRASQFNPLDGTYTRKELKDRMVDLGDGIIVQRDLLSAYIILNTIGTDQIDGVSAYNNFNRFKQMNDREVERLRTAGQLSWYVN